MGTLSRQLGRDVPVTPVPFGSTPQPGQVTAGFRPSSPARDLKQPSDGKPSFMLSEESTAGLTVVPTPTGEAFTHTHVKFGVYLGLYPQSGERKEDKQTKSLCGCNPLGESALQDQYKT